MNNARSTEPSEHTSGICKLIFGSLYPIFQPFCIATGALYAHLHVLGIAAGRHVGGLVERGVRSEGASG